MFAVVPALVLGLITFWFYRRLIRATAIPRPWSWIGAAILIALWALVLIAFASGSLLNPAWARFPAAIGMTWMAVGLYLSLGIILIGGASLIARLVHRLRPSDDAVFARRRLAALRVSTAILVVGSLGTVGYGLTEAADPKVTTSQVQFDRLPEGFDGMRVAVISDLHVGPVRDRGFTQDVVNTVMAQSPDLIVLPGDLIDGTVALVGDDLEPLRGLSAPLGVFAVSGNHEFYADDGGHWFDRWRELGIRPLLNERVALQRNGSTIDLTGIQDRTAPEPYAPDLAKALAGRDPTRFVMLAAHEPLQAEGASDAGVDFQMSGHTHAGQIWPLRYLVPLQQPTVEGLDHIGNTTIYTTRGAGAWGPPVRVAAPPEISILELAAAR
ncbi:metallophosphoesterase [Gordonia sp. CPCC 205515]|uniref:metallophosphoesterase n=1 Tax=Gordonia sp. CPCC 205515 TaxID=3140791 RepID=UPI003AF407E5